MAVGKRNVRWGAFKIPGLQVKSVRFISTIEDDHKVKVRKVIVTSSKVISRVPAWCLNINKIGWEGMHPRACLALLVWWRTMTRQIVY